MTDSGPQIAPGLAWLLLLVFILLLIAAGTGTREPIEPAAIVLPPTPNICRGC
jgi:hypothetical protein